MSRIGKKPIEKKGVKLALREKQLSIEGPKGKLEITLPMGIEVKDSDKFIQVIAGELPPKKKKAFHGLYRALIQNMVTGVTKGFEKRLEITGVGFRAKLEGKKLNISLGFSHPVIYPLPEGITAKVENKDTLIILNGIDRQLLGNVAAEIRSYYPPEPYKGKGVKYSDEVIRRKKGKRVA